MGANEMVSEAVSTEDFLSAMNTVYMAEATSPQADMIRLTPEAAKQILSQNFADVYKLLPDVNQKLNPIDAAKPSVWNNVDFAFAIKREDISALDKWAEKAAVVAVHKAAERGEYNKNKTTGEEL
jgi:hypothetical protein